MSKVDKMEQLNQKNNLSLIKVPSVSGLLANLLIFGVFFAAWFSIHFNPKYYYLSIQEDQIIEWMTFWFFFAAGIIYSQAAYRQYRLISKIPWFLVSVSIFCFFVSISYLST